MKILGIETSCDETAASVVEDGVKILSNVVVSQIDIFAAYGGVIPEVAARSHLEAILPVIDKSLKDAKLSWDDIDAIAVTHTPGLLGSLLIGTLTARTLATLHEKPLYPVHHLKSHIYANWIETEEKPTFPLLAIVISGGHTQILYMKEHNHFEIIGTTHDDAIGECFDKVAKILGLPYPGGPSIAKAAKSGDEKKYKLPHPKVENLDFSFSGLKTAVLRAVQKELGLPISHPSHDLKNHLTDKQIADFAASFEKTAVDILLEKLNLALSQYPEVKSIVFAGGVSANEHLKKVLLPEYALIRGETTSLRGFPEVTTEEKTPEPRNDGREGRRSPEEAVSASESKKEQNLEKLRVFFPQKSLSGDNGAMVASAAFFEIKSGVEPSDPYKLNILPRSAIK